MMVLMMTMLRFIDIDKEIEKGKRIARQGELMWLAAIDCEEQKWSDFHTDECRWWCH